MSTGKVIGDHRIQGIGDGFIPELVDLNKLDENYFKNYFCCFSFYTTIF